MLKRTGVVLAAVLISVMAACGTTRPLTHAELIRRAEAICAEYQNRGEKVTREFSAARGSVRQRTLRYAPRALALEGKSVNELVALTPPSNLKIVYRRYTDAERTRLLMTERLLAAIRNGTDQTVINERSAAASYAAIRAARALDIAGCPR